MHEVNAIPMHANTITAAKTFGISKLLCATTITDPKPIFPVNHSPTIAPITDKGAAILSEAKIYGSEIGTRKRRKIFQFEAATELNKSTISGFTDLNPMRELIMTGKNVISAAIKILGTKPKPNQITNKGTIATSGVTFTRTAKGYIVRSIHFE